MAGSKAEREIRTALVEWIHDNYPSARVVHEVNVATGRCRIDVAAVRPDQLIVFEIKSGRDKLDRLKKQARLFRRVAHCTVIVADQKFFETKEGYRISSTWPVDELEKGSVGCVLWRWPAADRYGGAKWCFRDIADNIAHRHHMPSTFDMLDLLWAAELRSESGRHSIAHSQRSTRLRMIGDMVMMMTGREIFKAVCRQLRGRHFAEADDPIHE